MARDPNDKTPVDSEMLEFEITDFGAARAALDELPPGVGATAPKTEAEWAQRRRKPVATDRALTGSTIVWLLSLPLELRPSATSEQYPRAVNLLAEAWPDEARRHAVFSALLDGQRAQRRGFPTEVRAELEALRSASAPPA